MTEYTLKLVEDVAAEPLDVDTAKYHLRVDSADDDNYITSLITVARQAVENEINRPLGVQTFEMGLQNWYGCEWNTTQYTYNSIDFPRSPFVDLLSIKYTLDDDSEVPLMDTEASPVVESTIFRLDDSGEPAAIYLKRAESWPSDVLAEGHPIKIKFTAGYEDVPLALTQAMLLLIGHLYENRESVVVGDAVQVIELPQAVQWLCAPYKYSFYR